MIQNLPNNCREFAETKNILYAAYERVNWWW